MLGNKPPYTTMQQLNLDWVLSKLKTLLRLVPDDGAVGQILRRTRDGAVWSDEQGGGGGGAVQSVNGQTGAVVLDAADVGALPDDYTPPVTSVNGETGVVVLDAADVGALPDDYAPPVTSVNGKTGAVVLGKSDVGLGNVDNVRQYSTNNPPPYPVTSVNGKTGAVTVLQYVDVAGLNVSIQANGGYQNLGTFASFGVPTSAYIVSFFVRGWSGGSGSVSLVASSDGKSLYAMMSDCPSSITINVRIYYTFL
jgi:hypothetical protein